ncbi:MAG: hypothetical protein N2252_03135, partial [Candidatus Kryptonium sp.]|nr:hypothetical protein [Candidatus Kryptonium sp.]
MSERILVFFVDIFSVFLSWSIYYIVRVESGWFSYYVKPEFWAPMIVVSVYWLVIFWLFGLYQPW